MEDYWTDVGLRGEGVGRGRSQKEGAGPKEGVAKRGRGQSRIFSVAYIRELYKVLQRCRIIHLFRKLWKDNTLFF
jgi:hypothetical protein